MEKDFVKFNPEALQIQVELPNQPNLTIGKEDVDISFFSKGHGGQNVNRHMNGVRLIYRIPESHLKLGPKTRELTARSIVSRSQEHNLKDAFRHLAQKVRQYFYEPPFRKATKTPKKQKQKRLEEKKRRGAIKESRKVSKLDL